MEWLFIIAIAFGLFVYGVKLRERRGNERWIKFLAEQNSRRNTTQSNLIRNEQGQFYNPNKLRPQVHIIYKDKNGEITERNVIIKHIIFDTESNKALYIEGKCSIWNEKRTFRIDRILKMVDMQSGEIINDPGSYIMKWSA